MKRSYFLFRFVFVLFVAGCGLLNKDAERTIVGKYAREVKDKNGMLYDTIEIQTFSVTAHQYLVEQKLVYKRTKAGKVFFKDRTKNSYASFFNKDKDILEIPELMAYVVFDDDELVVGDKRYIKL